MSGAVTLFNQPKLAIPSHIGAFFDVESNIDERQVVPSLGYEGKVWQINLNGEKTKLVKTNSEGDEEPIATMRVVVLEYAKRRGRTYYEGAYDPNKIGAPVCASDDGITPSAHIDAPQSVKCENCPMSIKGSKITDSGKPIAACSQHRILAVVPANNLDFTPLRMKIAITSDYDKQSPDLEAQGWHAFSNYTSMLRAKGVQHTAALVTKMRFDPNVAYPKLLFSPDRWLEPAEMARVVSVVKSEAVTGLIESKTIVPAVPAPVVSFSNVTTGAANVTVAAAMVNVPTVPKASPAPKAAPKAAAPKAAPAKQLTLMDDDEEDAQVAPKAAAAPVVSTTMGEDVASLLAEWGED